MGNGLRNEMEQITFRNEMKYFCTEQQLELLERRICHLMRPDPHTDETGSYIVRSVYFDDYEDSCYYENEDGVNHRKKFRIRIYDSNPDFILLECKQKRNNKNHKYTCRISEEQCRDILQGSFKMPKQEKNLLQTSVPLQENALLDYFFMYYRSRLLRPKVIVQYKRTPFIYELGNVRVTFDRNISASAKTACFLDQQIQTRPVMAAGMQLLEVKYDDVLPRYIYDQLQLGSLQLTSNSKYYIARNLTKGHMI